MVKPVASLVALSIALSAATATAQRPRAVVVVEGDAGVTATIAPAARQALLDRGRDVVDPGEVDAARLFIGLAGPLDEAGAASLASALSAGTVIVVEVRPGEAGQLLVSVRLHAADGASVRFGAAAPSELGALVARSIGELIDPVLPPPIEPPIEPSAAEPVVTEPREPVAIEAPAPRIASAASPVLSREEPRAPPTPASPLLVPSIVAAVLGALTWLASPLYAYAVCAYRPSCGEIVATTLVPIAGAPLAILQHWWQPEEEAGFWTFGIAQLVMIGLGVAGLVGASMPGEAPADRAAVRLGASGLEVAF